MADAGTARRVADAMKARDFAALEAELAADVVLHSPITASFQFAGRENVLALLRVVRDAYEEVEYVHCLEQGDVGFQFFNARVGGRQMQGSRPDAA